MPRPRDGIGAQKPEVLLPAKACARLLRIVGARTVDDAMARAQRQVNGASVDEPLGERRHLSVVGGPRRRRVGDAAAQHGRLALDVARLRVPLLGVDKGWRWRVHSRRRRHWVAACAKGHLGLDAAVRVGRVELGLHGRQEESIESTMLAAVLTAEKARGLIGQALARRGRNAQHIEYALVFGRVVGNRILALCIRDELAVGLPIPFAVAGAPLEVGLRRRRSRWRRVAIDERQRWRRRRHRWPRWAGRHERARAVVEALDFVGDHGRARST